MSYGKGFYESRDEDTRYAARRILGVLYSELEPVRSAVDFGCGVGTWLSVLAAEFGTGEILGLEGAWVDEDQLAMPAASFRSTDLATAPDVQLPHRFDLAICLEVAEHLPRGRGEWLVQQLTAASDAILFSAAIPGQGGVGHVNERWPSYWQRLFEARGFALDDCIRGAIWDDSRIPVWYRQNVLLYVVERGHDRQSASLRGSGPVSIVHPELFTREVTQRKLQPGVREAFGLLRRSLGRWAGRVLGRRR